MQDSNAQETSVLKSFSKAGSNGKKKLSMAAVSIIVVLAGVGTGWLLSGNSLGMGSKDEVAVSTKDTVKSDSEAGIADESAFKESEAPIGILQEGGINGEGYFHLERPGGQSQNVYLTSTVIDLGTFVGKKVQVWGETLSAQKAGWLMDVGKIKVVK